MFCHDAQRHASVIEGGDLKEIGLAAYPGARPRNDAAGDNKTASLAVSTPLFGLKIASAKFQTEDSADKVLAFYRKEMSKYGDVVDDHKEELKVGPDDDLRIVAVKPLGKEPNSRWCTPGWQNEIHNNPGNRGTGSSVVRSVVAEDDADRLPRPFSFSPPPPFYRRIPTAMNDLGRFSSRSSMAVEPIRWVQSSKVSKSSISQSPLVTPAIAGVVFSVE